MPRLHAGSELILQSDRVSAAKGALFSLALVAVSLWAPQAFGFPWVGYALAGYFTLSLLWQVRELLPGALQIRISNEGLCYSVHGRETKYPWSAIDCFFLATFQGGGVTCHGIPAFRLIDSFERTKLHRDCAKLWAGSDCVLTGKYPMSDEELVALLNEWRDEMAPREPRPDHAHPAL